MPSTIRQKLGLNSGDRLEADLVKGTIVLRPAAKASNPVPRDEQSSDPAVADLPEPLTPEAAMPARRKPGRPRKGEAAARARPRCQAEALMPTMADANGGIVRPPVCLLISEAGPDPNQLADNALI